MSLILFVPSFVFSRFPTSSLIFSGEPTFVEVVSSGFYRNCFLNYCVKMCAISEVLRTRLDCCCGVCCEHNCQEHQRYSIGEIIYIFRITKQPSDSDPLFTLKKRTIPSTNRIGDDDQQELRTNCLKVR